jgi:archaellum biogenesis ATPase FlaH
MTDERRQTTTTLPTSGDASPNGHVDVTTTALEKLDIHRILAAPPPQHDWVWDGYIERGTLTVLHGDGGTGKSILAGHLARAITTGGTCLGRPTQQGNVLIIDAENPIDEIARRMHALDYASTPPDAITYYRASEAILGQTGHVDIDRLTRLTDIHEPSVVILDSQRGLWSGEEKDAIEIRPLYRTLQHLAEHAACSMIVIHHDRRIGGYSGSSDIHNSADTRLHLERPDPDKPERVLHHAKARSSAELQPAAYTFTFDQQLGLFTFTSPREPITDAGMVIDALDVDEWRTAPEIRERAGLRLADAKTILWELVRAGDAQSMSGPPGRSKRAIGFRRTHPSTNSSQTRDQSGSVAQNLPRRTDPPPGPHIEDMGQAGSVGQAELIPPGSVPLIPEDDIPF